MEHSLGSNVTQHARPGRWRQRLWWSLWSLLVALGLALGLWQWERGEQKRAYLARLESAPALTAPHREPPEGSRVTLSGEYQADATLFLDNRIHAGRLGVAPLTPLRGDDGRLWLVQRGFLETGTSRADPDVATPDGRVTVRGRWQAAGKGAPLFGPNHVGARLQRIQLDAWPLDFAHPGWLHLEEGPGVLPGWWSPNVMPPSRHVGYAIQWWGLALVALVVMVIGGRRMIRDRDDVRSEDPR